MSLKKQLAEKTKKHIEIVTETSSKSTELHDEWERLRVKYDMGSFELNHFYQIAFRQGALARREIEIGYEIRDLQHLQSKTILGRIKRLFRI